MVAAYRAAFERLDPRLGELAADSDAGRRARAVRAQATALLAAAPTAAAGAAVVAVLDGLHAQLAGRLAAAGPPMPDPGGTDTEVTNWAGLIDWYRARRAGGWLVVAPDQGGPMVAAYRAGFAQLDARLGGLAADGDAAPRGRAVRAQARQLLTGPAAAQRPDTGVARLDELYAQLTGLLAAAERAPVHEAAGRVRGRHDRAVPAGDVVLDMPALLPVSAVLPGQVAAAEDDVRRAYAYQVQ